MYTKNMEKPEVTLENYEAVYDYYLEHQQPRLKALAAYAFLALKYHPRVHYADGAKDYIRNYSKADGPFLIAANHLTNHSDQFILAATAMRSPLWREIGHMRVLGKDELFQDEKQREQIDMMGTIPVFRSKNHGLRAAYHAGQRMIQISAERLHRGDSLAIFPEGTHNEHDPAVVQKASSGIGHIAARAADLGTPLNLLSIGIAYDQAGPRPNVKSASVYINTPIEFEKLIKENEGEMPTPAGITRRIKTDLQDAVTHAHNLY